jgi:hypothetical protein
MQGNNSREGSLESEEAIKLRQIQNAYKKVANLKVIKRKDIKRI